MMNRKWSIVYNFSFGNTKIFFIMIHWFVYDDVFVFIYIILHKNTFSWSLHLSKLICMYIINTNIYFGSLKKYRDPRYFLHVVDKRSKVIVQRLVPLYISKLLHISIRQQVWWLCNFNIYIIIVKHCLYYNYIVKHFIFKKISFFHICL